jgi:hypothetical protein
MKRERDRDTHTERDTSIRDESLKTMHTAPPPHTPTNPHTHSLSHECMQHESLKRVDAESKAIIERLGNNEA